MITLIMNNAQLYPTFHFVGTAPFHGGSYAEGTQFIQRINWVHHLPGGHHKKGDDDMALFRLEAKIISRSQGKSACSAAAYRAGQKIVSGYDGETYDYRRKQNVEDAVVILPDNAPAEYYDRASLWSAVELYEKQANAQLAREIMLVLPRELSFEERRQMTIEYVQEQFANDGMCADIAFHNPPRMNSKKQPIDINGNVTFDPASYIYDNPHAHVMLTLRPLDESGVWMPKKQKLYVVVKNDEERLMSPADLKIADGWEKIYHYTDQDGHKSWLTKTYVGEQPENGYKLISKYPKSVQDTNPRIAKWNAPETLVEWRAAWAEKVNMTLKLYGIDEEVSHLSYKDQGLDLIPTIHEGKEVTIAEKRLKEEYDRKIAAGEEAVLQHTEIRNFNIAIKEHNQELKIIYHLQKLKQQMSNVIKPVINRMETISLSVAEQLEHLRCQIIVAGIKIKDLVTVKSEAEEKIRFSREYLETLNPMREDRIQSLERKLSEYKEKHDRLSYFHKQKKNELIEKIKMTGYEISVQRENIKYVNDVKNEISDIKEKINGLDNNIREMEEHQRMRLKAYQDIMNNFSEANVESLNLARQEIRPSIEKQYVSGLGGHRFKQEAQSFDNMREKIERPEIKLNMRMARSM